MQLMRSPSLLSTGWRCARRPIPPSFAPQNLYRFTSAGVKLEHRPTQIARAEYYENIGTIDAKWQERWRNPKFQPAPVKAEKKEKAYILPMFPYPSGNLHLGHLRVYTISDILARFKQMQGYDVIHPIGWDAFGLPAENAAIERGISPAAWTLQNIAGMKEQMQAMGGRWDWDRELLTCDPSFYKHTQKLFLMLHEKGLAYQAESMVNYDPVDKTVLANEQVDANGCSWRSGAKVEKVNLKQWFLKIKEFQQPLLDDLEVLAKGNKWPERVLAMQKHWLGKSEGAKLKFELESIDGTHSWPDMEVYTTRPDTLFGVQYLALSVSHPIVVQLAKEGNPIREFVDRARGMPSDSKEGWNIRGIRAKNPLFSACLDGLAAVPEWIPVYCAPYVLDHYGSGAVMGVPGHDTRDYEFWKANSRSRNAIKVVVTLEKGAPSNTTLDPDFKPITGKGYVAEELGAFSGMTSDEARDAIIKALQEKDVYAEKGENWRLRDWLISRQRYWGTPIPIIHCDTCGPVPVPDSDLPVELPNLADQFFKGKTGNPLQDIKSWKTTKCPKCHAKADRETDTMDTFMDSSWYFMRFLDPKNMAAPISSKNADTGMPVDVYVGGVEHAILHLLYARFISKFLATTPLWPSGGGPENKAEPFKRLITQGMVHGKTYSDPSNGRFLRPDELDTTDPRSPKIKSSGLQPLVSYEKMSKSKYNGVDPGTTIATYGADATRAHMLFQAPVSEVLEWNEGSISGIQRWFARIWKLSAGDWLPPTNQSTEFTLPEDQDATLDTVIKFEKLASFPTETDLWLKTQDTIASVTDSYSHTYALNTVVSDLMSLTNAIWDTSHSQKPRLLELPYLAFTSLLRMLAPIAPAFTEECWERLHHAVALKELHHPDHPLRGPGKHSGTPSVRSVFSFGFPRYDAAVVSALTQTQTCAVMVDGRLKFSTKIPLPPAEFFEGGKVGELRRWVVDALRETQEGRVWMGEGGRLGWPAKEECRGLHGTGVEGMNVVVVKGGKTVNFVSPKKKREFWEEKRGKEARK